MIIIEFDQMLDIHMFNILYGNLYVAASVV
jgi:hypothetical protein